MASGAATGSGADALHTSSLLCKLLSPLLTTHGMDRRTGKAVPLARLQGRDVFDCASLADRAFLVPPELLTCPGYGIDRTGSADYLSETLDEVLRANGGDSRLVPLHVDGDGHCLVHAVSRALVGRELFWHALRTALRSHLAAEAAAYRALLSDFLLADEWDDVVTESEPAYRPPPGTPRGLRNVHLLGLAGVLRRPIVLLDSRRRMASSADYAGTFLPGLVPPDQLRRPSDGKLHPPLCVAWANPEHVHFVPLVGVRGLVPPVLPRALLPKVWGFTDKALEDYIDFSGDCCVVGGDRALSDGYVARLIAAARELFAEKHGVPPSFVVDCQESLDVGSWETDEEIIASLKLRLGEGRLYRCLACGGVSLADAAGDASGDAAGDAAGDAPSGARPGGGADGRAPSRCAGCRSERLRKILEDGSTLCSDADRTVTRSADAPGDAELAEELAAGTRSAPGAETPASGDGAGRRTERDRGDGSSRDGAASDTAPNAPPAAEARGEQGPACRRAAEAAERSDAGRTRKELALLNTMADVLGDDLWSFVKKLPYTFCETGVFCRKASEDLVLEDGVHCSFPCLPGKVFVYNGRERRLDVCLAQRGHRAVGPEPDEREAAWPPEANGGDARTAVCLTPRRESGDVRLDRVSSV